MKADIAEKPALATKQTAKTTGGYPLIAGTWQEVPTVQVNITQRGSRIEATTVYRRANGEEVRWRMEGTITKDGRFQGDLVHTKGVALGPGVRQLRVGTLGPDGVIRGHASWPGGGHDFSWTRVKPAEPSDR